MLAKDLMRRDVSTVRDDSSVSDLVDLLVREHIHGCPVIDAEGTLVGVVTQQDVFFSGVPSCRKEKSAKTGSDEMKVCEVMTSPAVAADEQTEMASLCRMMYRLRIHRVPIVKDGKVTGIISSLDIVGQLAGAEGQTKQ